MSKIKCSGVNYRQGFIEVIPQIHDKHINIETWNINPDIQLDKNEASFEELNDGAFTANTEVELSVEQAQILIDKLSACIKDINGSS